ncbi:putative augmin 3 [Klebsormidium nitens]|uniref:Putative augmin 3 n=1 Tax=Klebsormidium nitens TaxID=105231 RepID=A0A1Y1IBK8_KLENI|nr:putative augmin 3 [Klebsormidium nitens]|eukprot:GAQ88300.1 putative augmin 3 [Klebsormidium nitens]
MEWICANLSAANVLTQQEVALYMELVQDGKVLEGEDLDAAFASISAFESDRSIADAVLGVEESAKLLREETAALRAEAEALRQRSQRMLAQRDLLAAQDAELVHKRRVVAKTADASRRARLAAVEDQLAKRNAEMNQVLEDLASAAEELAGHHSQDGDQVYLSVQDMRNFTSQDASCSHQLDAYFTRQFHEGPTAVVARQGIADCSWVVLDDLSDRFVKGESASTYAQRVLELRRLRAIFGISERQWVDAQAERARQREVLRVARLQQAESQQPAHLRSGTDALRRRQADAEAALYGARGKEAALREGAVAALCWDLAALQDTYILEGDYDLKIMRHEYYLQQQKKFIGYLVAQQARHLFLQLACYMEQCGHRGAHDLLCVAHREVEALVRATETRSERCSELKRLATQAQAPAVIDERDPLLSRLRDLLGSEKDRSAGPPLATADALVRRLRQLQGDVRAQRRELDERLATDKRDVTADLYGLIHQMQRRLFGAAATVQPVLTPPEVRDALSELEAANQELSGVIEKVSNEHRHRAEIVRHHPHEIGLERQVFVDFFSAPDRLRAHVHELQERVRAHDISADFLQRTA